MKTIFPKSKYEKYSGKSLLLVLIKDFSKIFGPISIIVPIIILYFKLPAIVNDKEVATETAALLMFLSIVIFWIAGIASLYLNFNKK